MATIELESIRKRYPNGFEAVKGIDLAIAEGEFMVLVGPSGCGKTTVLRMVAGLETISDGVLRIGGQVVNNVEPQKRDIAMVFQNYALYPHMTVAENIGFSLKMKKVAKKEIEGKVANAAQILGLSESLKLKPGQLSGGQRQRVAMGRAIVREPSAFLMDEPLSNLDAKLRVQMRAEVSRIQHRVGVATVYVTHDQVEAMTMGDRVAVMKDGTIQQCDKPQSLYDRPMNMFVAAFIGSPSMNLYEAGLDETGEFVHLGSQSLRVPPVVFERHQKLRDYCGKDIVVGIRPEHLPVATEHDESGLRAEVDLVEALGSELMVHFVIDAKSMTAEYAYEEDDHLAGSGSGIARVDARSAVVPGKTMVFGSDVNRWHFFDKTTEEAM